jgi:hypothetical protein
MQSQPVVSPVNPYDQQIADWRNQNLAGIYKKALGPAPAFEPEDIAVSPSVSVSPEELHQYSTNDALLSLYLQEGEELPMDGMKRAVLRSTVSNRLYGQDAPDESALFSLVQKDAQRRVDQSEITRQIQSAAYLNAAEATPDNWTQTREAIRQLPGYDPTKDSDYLESYLSAQDEIGEKIDPIREQVREMFGEMKTGKLENVVLAAFRLNSSIPPESKEAFREALAARIDAMPEAERRSFGQLVKDTTARHLIEMAGKVGQEALSVTTNADPDTGDALQAIGAAAAGGMGGVYVAPPAVREAQEQRAKEYREAKLFAREMSDMFQRDVDPFKSAFNESGEMGILESAATNAPGVLLNSLSMGVPLVGLGYTFLGAKGYAFDNLSRRFQESKMSEEDSAKYADSLSLPVALFQTALEKVGFDLWTNKIPAASALLRKFDDAIANVPARLAAKTAAITAAETGVEFLQDVSELAVQDVAAALERDLPSVDWQKELKGSFRKYGEVAITMLPLAIIGAAGGLSREAQASAFKQATRDQRLALGITPEDSDAIESAPGPVSLLRAVQRAMAAADKNSATAMEAAAREQQRLTSLRQAEEVGTPLDYRWPIFRAETDGTFSVLDPTTRETVAVAPTYSKAIQAAEAHTTALDQLRGDLFVRTAALLSAGERVAKRSGMASEIDFTRVFTDEDAKELSPQAAERYAAENEILDQAEGGSGDAARVVFGYNATEIRNNHRQAVIKLFSGATLGTVFHEEWHKLRARAMAAGVSTRDHDLQLLRAFDQAYGEHRMRTGEGKQKGRKIKFVPDNFAEQTPQRQEEILDEAIAEIAEVATYLFPDRKLSKHNKHGLTREFISKYIGAVGRIAPEATRNFRTFIRSIRDSLGLSLTRAYQAKKAIKEGRLDIRELDNYIERLTSTLDQSTHDKAVDQIAQELTESNVDTPFSLGSTTPERSARYLELAKDPEANREDLQAGATPEDVMAKYNLTPEQDAEYLAAVERGDLETAQRMVDEAAKAAGYIMSHKQRSPQINPRGDVILFVDDETSNDSYGSYTFSVKGLPKVPDYVKDFAKSYFGEDGQTEPEDIIESAQAWDDRQFVSDLWQEFGDRFENEGIIGFKTPDGGVVFDRVTALENGQIKSADPVTYDEQGNVIPLSQRFAEAKDAISFSLGRSTVTPTANTRAYQGAEGSPSVIGPASFSIGAWHATPHKVDKFGLDKIGTGEGAQAYGYGLYFAESEAVSGRGGTYDSQFSNSIRYNGETLNWGDEPTARSIAAELIESYRGDPDAKKLAASDAEGYENAKEIKKEVRSLDPSKIERGANIYRVKLDVNDSDLLDWDKPFNEQPKSIQEIINKRQWENQGIGGYWMDKSLENPSYNGGDLYQRLSGTLGSPEAASAYLREAGIPGIRYLDGNSRADGQGSYNYVIFDESKIKITEENGTPVAMEEVSFSLGRAGVAQEMANMASTLSRAPIRRLRVMRRISSEFAMISQRARQMEALEGVPLGKAELKRQASLKEELSLDEKVAEIHSRFGDLLNNDDLTRLRAQPIHAWLARPGSHLHGVLMSRKQYLAHASNLDGVGMYDGSESVSRTLFGGQQTPDIAARGLYAEGLIPDSTPESLWEALAKEANSVYRNKEHLKKAQEQIRQAKIDAKKEAADWLAAQTMGGKKVYNPKREILDALKMLDAIDKALPPSARVGGHTQIANINAANNKALLKFLKVKMAKAYTNLEAFLREEYGKEMQDILKRIAPKGDKPGEKPTGNIHPDAYRVLSHAQKYLSKTFEEAETEADRLLALADKEQTKPEDADIYRAQSHMVGLMGAWMSAPAERRATAVEEATKIYLRGLSHLAIKRARRKLHLDYLASSAAGGIKNSGERMARIEAKDKEAGIFGTIKGIAFRALSFGQVSNALFGEASAFAKWANRSELSASNLFTDNYAKHTDGFQALIQELAGSPYKAEKLLHRIQNERSLEVVDGRNNLQKYTEAEAMGYVMTYRQEDGMRHMQGTESSSWGWTDESMEELESKMSPEAKAIMEWMSANYVAGYPRINEVYERIWDFPLPSIRNYSPLTLISANAQDNAGIVDPVTMQGVGAGVTPSSFRNRSATAIAEPESTDAIALYFRHWRQMEHFIAYGELARDAIAVTGRGEIRKKLLGISKTAQGTLGDWLDFFRSGGVRATSRAPIEQAVLQRALGRMSAAVLVGRVSVIAMQSLQIAAGIYKMPMASYLSRFARLTTGRLNYSEAFRSAYIQRRMHEMPPALRDSIAGLSSSSPNVVRHYASRMASYSIPTADAVFTAGTYAILYDYHLADAKKQGVPEADRAAYAQDMAELVTDQIAQPMRPGARSMWELQGQANPYFRVLHNFASDLRQKLSIPIYEIARTDKTASEKVIPALRALAVTWAVGGVLTTLVRAIVRDMRDPEDDELFDEKNWDVQRLVAMAATAPLGGIPVFGDMAEAALFSALRMYLPDDNMLDTVPKAYRAAMSLAAESGDPMKDVQTLMTGLAFFSPFFAGATPFANLIKDSIDLIDNATGPESED